ncbi:uncharacterized protein VTP21DRAFT_1823 [Calcarisporiella thermophila]|uniref:uncharacterized protein n=1 Tax=Calcarisporiella thermophila TaxID=911321 RepID=UPI003741FC40
MEMLSETRGAHAANGRGAFYFRSRARLILADFDCSPTGMDKVESTWCGGSPPGGREGCSSQPLSGPGPHDCARLHRAPGPMDPRPGAFFGGLIRQAWRGATERRVDRQPEPHWLGRGRAGGGQPEGRATEPAVGRGASEE